MHVNMYMHKLYIITCLLTTRTYAFIFDFNTFIAGGAIGIKLSPLWYVMDSCPIIRAPPNGSGTERNKIVSHRKGEYTS